MNISKTRGVTLLRLVLMTLALLLIPSMALAGLDVLDWQCMSETVKSSLGASEYWTGTEIDAGKAYYCKPSTAVYGIANKNTNPYNSRACLAF